MLGWKVAVAWCDNSKATLFMAAATLINVAGNVLLALKQFRFAAYTFLILTDSPQALKLTINC